MSAERGVMASMREAGMCEVDGAEASYVGARADLPRETGGEKRLMWGSWRQPAAAWRIDGVEPACPVKEAGERQRSLVHRDVLFCGGGNLLLLLLPVSGSRRLARFARTQARLPPALLGLWRRRRTHFGVGIDGGERRDALAGACRRADSRGQALLRRGRERAGRARKGTAPWRRGLGRKPDVAVFRRRERMARGRRECRAE